ncbi:MAG: hypothetical protein ACD_79C00252G0012 [uncultured bacterium]|nr:MAG: hypothetical protein ACD_79C00252G0012 [uncultured bacterium]
MDTTDPDIYFDSDGNCNHCNRVINSIKAKKWLPNVENEKQLNLIIDSIRKNTKHLKYNAVIGLSGGVDSSYLAYYLVKRFGLKLLAIHVDTGWNRDISVSNIENIVKQLGIDLYTHVVNWEEMKNLQIAFLKSGVPNQDIPQDHAIFAVLYSEAKKYKIPYTISGFNLATESILPHSWGYDAMDAIHIHDIYKRFGTSKLKDFPFINFWNYEVCLRLGRRIVVSPLNYIAYNKNGAKDLLIKELVWKDYGDKHFESIWTKYFQSYYLPVKFGYDKRRAHFSSLIMASQMKREAALEKLKSLSYDPLMINEDKEYIAKKLGLAYEEFIKLEKVPNTPHEKYKSWNSYMNILNAFTKTLKILGFKKQKHF